MWHNDSLEELAYTPEDDDGVTPKKKREYEDKRHRVQMRFWLDANNPRDNNIGYYLVETLKPKRQYQAFIRDACHLLMALRQGDVGPLVDMFPDLMRWLYEYYRQHPEKRPR